MISTISKTTRKTKMTEGNIYNNEDLFQIKDFMLVQRVIKRINSILDLECLLEQIIEDASSTLGFTKCGVLLYEESTDQLRLAAVTGWEDKIHKVGDRFNLGEGIVWRAFIAKKVMYYPDINEYPEEIHCDFTSQSHIDIPLISKGNVIGILNAQHKNKDGFSRHNIRILKTLGAHLSVAIRNAKLFEKEKLEKKLIIRELKEAQQIQTRFFPKVAPEISNFKLSGMCVPCFEVGGDWYDYIQLPSGKIGVVLADVSGKGLSAAFLMASARTVIRMLGMEEESPAELLKKVNRILVSDLPGSRFITLIYAVIDPQTRKINIASAGHTVPVLKSITGASFLHVNSGLPLGIKEFDYAENTVTMKKGERLFLYSDGVTEAMNYKNELFDDHRLISSLDKREADINTIYKDVKNFIADNNQSDDLTIVMIESV
ncbi:MAG TPA: GAF domain-containing SpoIIE family protein phosphatase [Ignavibacteriaceae bacterium]